MSGGPPRFRGGGRTPRGSGWRGEFRAAPPRPRLAPPLVQGGSPRWGVARFGGKRTWMASLALFLAGSALAGAAWNVGSLIAFRVLQGIGGGLMIPTMQTLLVRAAGGRNL